ncbi:MAG TPA: ATP-binding protein [Gammaproteobacteria bacterium]|nr:ATP-binding protein [Gammaproteobacteria bacterium]
MALVRSLRARVVLWVSVALVVLFAVTIVGLDVAFRESSDRALLEVLEAHVIGLVAAVDLGDDGELTLPVGNLDPEFQVANSGLFGAVFDDTGRAIWQSLSLIGRDFPVDELPPPGQRRYANLDVPGFPPLEALLMSIEWEFADGHTSPYTFAIASSLEPYNQRQASFRRALIAWFGGITLTMLIVVGGLLTFVLLPLHRLERQVREVEAGERASLAGEYPTELVGLADNLNALIATERRRLERYRHTLDDLAHSLKTPLAAMRTLLAELGTRRTATPEPQIDSLHRELERMDQRVSYQLRRARASGATGLGTGPVPVAPIVEDLKQTLDKVYRDKRVLCTLDLAPGAVFRGDPGDLTEILGNLMDNAYKYCKSKVRVAGDSNAERLAIRVGDDGGGIGDELARELGQRGKRADESVPGQGIGLAVVREAVELYRGALTVGRSELGGAEVRIELARAGAP